MLWIFFKKAREQIVNDDYKDTVLYSKEREIFKSIYNKRLDKTEELTKKIDVNNLTFSTISTGETVDFSRKNDPLTLLKKIRDGKITIERAKELQKYLNNNIKKYEKEIKLKCKTKTKKQWILIFFFMEEMKLLNFMMITLQWFLKLKKGCRRANRNRT